MQARLKSLVALLALTGLSAAYANTTLTINVAPTGSGTSFSGTVSDTPAVMGSFTDTYQFAGAPPAADMTLTIAAAAGITLTSVALEYYPFSTATAVAPNVYNVTGTNATVTAYDQSSGFWAWVVTGTSTSTTAKITGSITENTAVTITTAVPEPSAWALLVGGLGLMTVLSRKRMGGKRG